LFFAKKKKHKNQDFAIEKKHKNQDFAIEETTVCHIQYKKSPRATKNVGNVSHAETNSSVPSWPIPVVVATQCAAE
jgi:hypothetical protein